MKQVKIKSEDKILSINEISEKTMLKDVVFVNGCFDVLHSGHVFLLNSAKNNSDRVLVVGINSDQNISNLKGDSRPVISASQRAYLLSNLECVDYVFIFNEDKAVNSIRILQPVFWFKGPDYNEHNIDAEELDALKSVGGKLKCIKEVPEDLFNSTTQIIKKIENQQMIAEWEEKIAKRIEENKDQKIEENNS